MLRFCALILTTAVAFLIAPIGARADWACKPVWAFSGMGDKSYSGAGNTEQNARKSATDDCVLNNRGLELDDFCLVAPKNDDWHCAPASQEAAGNHAKS